MLTTNQKGLIAETAIVKECVELDIGICQPLGPERYDLIIDLRPRLLRVQCKWANLYGDVVIARLYSNRRGPNGMIRRQYTADEVDGFAVYCGELRRSFNSGCTQLGTISRSAYGGRRTTNSPLD